MSNTIKCVVVGDGAVGKTCLLIRYAKNTFPHNYVPTIFDNYAVNVDIKDEQYTVGLYDTAGQEGYDRLRPLSYNKTDVFLLCFSVVIPSSFENIKEKWLPEIKHFCSRAHYILVGTQIDKREEPEVISKLHLYRQKPIYREDAEKMAKKLKAYAYIECSALTMQGVKDVFDEAIMAALEPKPSKSIIRCPIL